MGDRTELRDGAEWADHEYFLIGNEEGLRRLRDACDVALRDGEYAKGDLGQWEGIRRLDSSWFDDPVESTATRIGNKLIGPILTVILVVFLVGLVSIVRWLFSLF